MQFEANPSKPARTPRASAFPRFRIHFSLFTLHSSLPLLISLFTLHPSLFTSAAEPLPTISPQVKQSVDHAVKWLVEQQKPSGYFTEQRGEQPVKRGDLPAHSAAMTSLAIMGLTSVGSMPGDPTPEGRAVAKALKYMVDYVQPDENGYLGRSDRSRMYGHGIISLMIMEMLGMSQDEEVDRKLHTMAEGAVKLILQSQKVPKSDSNKGGWRYEPQSSDADMSVTVWQLMALRAAKNAGLRVPRDMAAAFSYEPYGGRQTFSTTAAGLLSLLASGQYEAPETIGSSNFLMKSPPAITEPWFFYGNYYYAQSMYQRGGDYAATARRKTEDTLLKNQATDGSWMPRNGNEKSAGPVYATSLALLSLSVYHHFLPIYQK